MGRPNQPLALITGATRGIGLAIVRLLAPRYRLILTARSDEALAWAAEDAQRFGGDDISTVACDLCDPDERFDLIEAVGSLEQPVQVLINNAGAGDSAPLVKTDDELWQRMIELNLTAPFALARGLAPAMIECGWGRIVNVASTAAIKGYRYTAAYSAAKAGLVGLTRALAAELGGRGITVNAVCPGFCDTDLAETAIRNIAEKTGTTADEARRGLERLSPMNRLVKPAEVAQMVMYLLSDSAAMLNGQAVVIDGGETVT
jgi:NAD(P)-dependent dehydrogenase (short-subunit alcohol dehydrogenase family)